MAGYSSQPWQARRSAQGWLVPKRREKFSLYGKRLPTTAFVFHVRVSELEAFIQTFLRVIELSTIEIYKTLSVYHHRDIIVLEYLIIRSDFISKLEDIRQTGTTCSTHGKTKPNTFASLVKKSLDVLCRTICERNAHF